MALSPAVLHTSRDTAVGRLSFHAPDGCDLCDIQRVIQRVEVSACSLNASECFAAEAGNTKRRVLSWHPRVCTTLFLARILYFICNTTPLLARDNPGRRQMCPATPLRLTYQVELLALEAERHLDSRILTLQTMSPRPPPPRAIFLSVPQITVYFKPLPSPCSISLSSPLSPLLSPSRLIPGRLRPYQTTYWHICQSCIPLIAITFSAPLCGCSLLPLL